MLPLSSQKNDAFDVLVVGASFAGLSFAGVAAALGLHVLVVERDAEIGGVMRCGAYGYSRPTNLQSRSAHVLTASTWQM